jgi:hypothetical protein
MGQRMTRPSSTSGSLDSLVAALPPLARVAILAEVVDDPSQTAATRQYAARTLLDLALAPTPEQTFTDRFIGLVRGVAPSAMHHKVRINAARSLLGAYGFLPRPLQTGLATVPHDILTESFGLARQESRTRREHAAIAAADLPGTRFVSHLIHGIKDGDTLVRHRALAELERRVAMAAEVPASAMHQELCRVVAAAALHGADDVRVRRQTAACLLVLGSPGCLRAASVAQSLENPTIIGALQGALRLTRLPVAGARAVELLLNESLRASALDRLTRLEEPAERDAALSRWHLLVRPARRRVIRSMKSHQATVQGDAGAPGVPSVRIGSKGLLPSVGEIPVLSAAAQVGAAAMSLVVHAEAPVREVLAQRLLGSNNAAVRLLARGMTPVRSLPDFIFDANEAVARGAAMRWLDAQRGGRMKAAEAVQVLAAMKRSPHASVRAMAMQWKAAEQKTQSSVLQLRGMLRADVSSQKQAIASIENQEQLAACAPVLSALAINDAADARVRASAISAMGRMRDQDSAAALVQVLEHAHEQNVEPRIVANALDALCKRVRTHTAEVRPELIEEFKQAPSVARVRASAIRLHAAIAPSDPTVAKETQSMLIDPRPDHRLSGVWLAGRLAPVIRGCADALESWERELDHLAARGSNASTRARACQSLLKINSAARRSDAVAASGLTVETPSTQQIREEAA